MKSPATGLANDQQPHADDDYAVSDATKPQPQSKSALRPGSGTTRPSLTRSPPGRLSEIVQAEDGLGSSDAAVKVERSRDGANESSTVSPEPSGTRRAASKSALPISEEEKLMRLRDAIDAKIVLQQQRKRHSYSSASSQASGLKRVSPIREEEGPTISPSLNAAFSSPVDASTISTESSGSVQTVRASVPATPSESRPARTPSYPFPLVPRTLSSSAFHQPFTALSPTVSASHMGERATPSSASAGMRSDMSTPIASMGPFAPPDTLLQMQEDPRYPTPNLYNLVLQLNTEPGMEQWWATVVNIMHEHFKAERVTLVMPLDSSDLENAPWGQKATFSMNGPEEFVAHHEINEQTAHTSQVSATVERTPDTDIRSSLKDSYKQKLHPERLRPRLETRHSYAGHGRDTKEWISEEGSKTSKRPPGPKRGATQGADTFTNIRPALHASHSTTTPSTPRHNSITDPDYSTVAGVDSGPHAAVFSMLRALNHEIHPLIEPHGVSRVLERGRLVMVTRDYVSGASSSSNDAASTQGSTSTPDSAHRLFGNYRSMLAPDNTQSAREYEETEQFPTSPWVQSPAPSPAIQIDEDANPFFASEEEQVEESFNPKSTPRDYSQLGQVDAIGVEKASTVLHLPLIHPTLSQPMQSLAMRSPLDHDNVSHGGDPSEVERKAPIAIVSILSPAVPYPQNWCQTLRLLGPHLATSFAIAQQYSAAHHQSVAIRHRRTASGQGAKVGLMTIEPTSLEDIVSAELDKPPGCRSVGSITSPSDYSGRSRYSPSNSIVGTPGWDPASHGWTSSRSQSSTPYTSAEMVDNYFDSKKVRSSHRSGSGGSHQTIVTSQRQTRLAPSQDGKASGRRISPPTSKDDDARLNAGEAKGRLSSSNRREGSPIRKAVAWESGRVTQSTAPSDTQFSALPPSDSSTPKRHSLLHSYGADWESSFGLTPVGTTGHEMSTPKPGHTRQNSYPEDMPPPSERLLRTIIDSVPVQIFTAKPDSGHMSWVNSKYLIYRGEEPRQALEEPWKAIHPDDREGFMTAWYRSLRTAQQLQQKVRLQRFDGNFRWFYVRAAPLRDKRQKIVHWIGTMMDFHEQQIAELNASRQQETAASEAKYRALANSSPQIVFAVSRERGVIFCNSQWLHYSGQPEAQALGLGFMDYVHPDDISKCRLPTFENDGKKPTNVPTSVPAEPRRSVSNPFSSPTADSDVVEKAPQRKLSELASTGILKVTRDADGRPSYSTEVRLKSKDGFYRWHLVRVLMAQRTSQSPDEEETWYGTCTDINDHKALERDLKETMDEKSRFLSNMSHEIRTPLNGITGMVNFLIDSNLTAEQMEHVNIIRASTEGLRGLINDILDLSKAEAGMIQLNMDWLYVRALIEEVNDLTSAMAIDKGLELNYLVDEDVPIQIKGDRFRLRQILLNIVGNAIKFTQQGEVFVRCTILHDDGSELDAHELFIKFEVIDTGQGFTEKEAEYLFKRFSQIDGSSTRQHGGTGLGLVISRQLAQLHGGDMSAKGVPNKGSTFTFFVKASLPSSKDQPPPAMTPGGGALVSIPILPFSPEAIRTPPIPIIRGGGPERSPSASANTETAVKTSLRFASQVSSSPGRIASVDMGRESPTVSSASSDPSVRSAARTSSLNSDKSSVSSFVPDSNLSTSPMKLALPGDRKRETATTLQRELSRGHVKSEPTTGASEVHAEIGITSPSNALPPPMYSILVVCPLTYSRDATVQHISKTLPKNVPHQITARESLFECQRMLGGDEPVQFTHVVVVLQDVNEIIALLDQVLSSPAQSATTIVVITDLAQRRNIIQQSPTHDFEKLQLERRLRFVFKPLKPSRFAIIFDPQKEREMSTDRNQDSAQQVAVSQKQVFDELSRRLGNRDKRVLLVEDNRVNQMVILKFLAKVSIKVETALDGVQCTEKVFSHPPGYYSIILCDLHMPNKDGYQTCKEIRKWELAKETRHQPIIALSANVLGDVYQKCVVAGFNSYMTKPVDFKELSAVLMAFMDPPDPEKPLEFLKAKPSKG